MGKNSNRPGPPNPALKSEQTFRADRGWYVSYFDIRKALHIVRGRRPSRTLDVSIYDPVIKNGNVGINWDHLETNEVNLKYPILAATLPSSKLFVIDGHHRITLALRRGVRDLPVVVLTQEETARIHTMRLKFPAR